MVTTTVCTTVLVTISSPSLAVGAALTAAFVVLGRSTEKLFPGLHPETFADPEAFATDDPADPEGLMGPWPRVAGFLLPLGRPLPDGWWAMVLLPAAGKGFAPLDGLTVVLAFEDAETPVPVGLEKPRPISPLPVPDRAALEEVETAFAVARPALAAPPAALMLEAFAEEAGLLAPDEAGLPAADEAGLPAADDGLAAPEDAGFPAAEEGLAALDEAGLAGAAAPPLFE
jgi:hypothetical protein